MRPTPIPDEEVWDGAQRLVIAPPGGDLTDPDIGSVEALIHTSPLGQTFSMRCVPEGNDLDVLRAGGAVWVSILGAQLQPFSVDVVSAAGSTLLPSLRLEVTPGDPAPSFEAYATGVPAGMSVSDFVRGCIEALEQMLPGMG